ncbi:ergothioneine biosynthesis protein EgtB [Flavobacteriaceae bacterium AU392]|nr:ergothioneine biosynthesis protein EgtB [Flavobacteriaceae bacterium]RKM85769.1 ergothioneine biosynthesis protein EgtB [Flavobacteriaceae bacterium AU392]
MNNLTSLFSQTRQRSEDICSPLYIEDYIPQSAEFASPPKWHLAHTTWFFEEMILKKYLKNYKIFNSDFNFLFNSYYNSVGDKAIRAERGLITRPTVDTVYKYRAYVDEQIKILLSDANDEINSLITIGIHHEQQHQELLLTDLKYVLSKNPLHPVYESNFNLIKDRNDNTGWVSITEGIYDIGHNSGSFCFDNELGYHKVFLNNYKISKTLVTNGEFIEFIEDGGYENFKYWLDEGWTWCHTTKANQPLYWVKKDNSWFYYTLSGLQPIDLNAILSHINYYEANAYATWKGYRLPTEFEWEIASHQFKWGKRWEWTNSAYLPYPNFKIAEGALGEYNGKFMINQMVLRGASVATFKGHSRHTYRNFFHPQLQWQFSGIRLAQ